MRFNVEARERYLRFARSPEALWSGNFRDLSASMTRLATLADGGRISTALVDAEIQRMQWLWQRGEAAQPAPAGAGRPPGHRAHPAAAPTAVRSPGTRPVRQGGR